MNYLFLYILSFILGILGVSVIFYEEKPTELTLIDLLVCFLLILLGPITFMCVLFEYGDSIVIWKRNK